MLFQCYVTAFGDIIVWEKRGMPTGIVQYNIQDMDIICKGLDLFIRFLDNSYVTDNFELNLYRQAVANHAQLAYDECFGFRSTFGIRRF